MGTNSIHMSIHSSIESMGRRLAKQMHMSFSRMVSGLIMKLTMEVDNMLIETGYDSEVIFQDLARTLNKDLSKLKFRVEA